MSCDAGPGLQGGGTAPAQHQRQQRRQRQQQPLPQQQEEAPLQGWVVSDLPLSPSTPEGTGGEPACL